MKGLVHYWLLLLCFGWVWWRQVAVSSFVTSLSPSRHQQNKQRVRRSPRPTTRPIEQLLAAESSPADNENTSQDISPLSTTSRLSHMMLKVQSTDHAVEYWTDTQGGTVLRSRKMTEDDSSPLQSAFVALGNGSTTENAFSLELVQTKDCQVGNVLNYIGVSLLKRFQPGNLAGLIAGAKPSQETKEEPHGIPVKFCASSPGDYLCRVCLKTNDLQQTQAFYETILGMQVAAADESQLCLRYTSNSDTDDDDDKVTYGVPTTLVFEGTNERLNHGTCLDHLAIQTSTSIGTLWEQLQMPTVNDVTIYMNPTEMFGMTVMGIRDPNGYKVVLAGPA